MAFIQPWFEVDFGSAYAGIGTTGFRLYKNDNTDSVARTTSGVVDLGAGGYGVPAVNVPDDAVGIEWDTGGGSPVYAREDIEPFADRAFLKKIVINRKTLEKTGSVWELIIYDDDDSTPILQKDLKDKDVNDITDLLTGTLAQELKSSV